MTSDQNLMLYAKLAGFRLVVLANRFGCDTDFSRELHDRLIEGLEAAVARIRVIMELERTLLVGDDEFIAYQLQGETEIFGRFTINLLDYLEIDDDTHEFRINGGNWINALTADDGGVEVNFPTLVRLTDDELGTLAPIVKQITQKTGIPVHAVRAVQS
ncbi:hypothetical protein [Rhizobium laguerreae]|uniref:hypothetical protein n=2 Tax=Rhizobium laguerreae TaxID=1076926 RepID=UPI001C9085A1|nr:hypothetical protein [Rhizobium laguerreae]MBY3219458.1 hypothetical protein [Rhizobium laguerreae]MBY3348924.1 hypothetical protein [Rhizobium laguerreae]MBY3355967.1 hypothetical protein [Rhizobium laguerreae]MBY3370172.1 hypothetical protein [Rhizobium laguerreae]MBY3377078.1 hypothetical protein [Rhizobium laguerreae]